MKDAEADKGYSRHVPRARGERFSRKERKGRKEMETAMKKMMIAAGFAARIHIGIAYASKRDQNRKWRFTLKHEIFERAD